MKIVMYTKVGCPYCENAKTLLSRLNLPFSEKSLDPRNENYNKDKLKIFNYFNHHSFPVIVINNKLLGGYSELQNALN